MLNNGDYVMQIISEIILKLFFMSNDRNHLGYIIINFYNKKILSKKNLYITIFKIYYNN